ncbi:hypothetical protein QQ020_21755 [Fulvivirgaceae bacterium BMA12]|uniref:Uncharacterized protein n=1 Tax=Agaribacillus aureus TaxID=3051825 RepID=A0ABT8LAE2_9BACT|nr:hypothetical protein [Fulvivirgaceae bacterium BMA12]
MNDLQAFIEKYANQRPQYEDFLQKIITCIKEEASKRKLAYKNIEGRIKNLASIKEKIKRQKISDPFSDIYDFAGARIVCIANYQLDLLKELFIV